MRKRRESVDLDDLRFLGRKSKGLKCPSCGGPQFKEGNSCFPVTATRPAGGSVVRYRTCIHCGHQWHTVER
jgi:hypothetical protein